MPSWLHPTRCNVEVTNGAWGCRLSSRAVVALTESAAERNLSAVASASSLLWNAPGPEAGCTSVEQQESHGAAWHLRCNTAAESCITRSTASLLLLQ